ncbi:MAG: hypothetical protein Q3968_07130 [Clostridiaceae bacterium]|nr:hypothetical protein [Clostridiaceae bacterium]
MSENKYPERKALRLPNYDYSQNGCYFITLLTDRKRWLFGTYNVRAIHESPLQRSTLSKIIGYLRMNISKEIHSASSNSEKIWHRNYYDRVIRNQREFENCWNYIEYNALKEYEKGYQK